jgi:membrane protein
MMLGTNRMHEPLPAPLPAQLPAQPPAWWGRVASRLPAWLEWPAELGLLAALRWIDVSGPQLGASIAFYTMFALAPLVVITIAVVGAVFGAEAARGEIVGQIQSLVGPTAAAAIEGLIANAWRAHDGLLSAAIGVVTLLVGASSVFAELRRALNQIGRVQADPSVVGAFVRVRLTAFALLLGFGFLAIASLLLSAAASAVAAYFAARHAQLGLLLHGFDFLLSVAVLGIAFAALLRWLPDRPPSSRALWLSSLVSALLFAIGKSVIGLYLGRASFASTYGAAGSFVVVLLWVYYSAQILLYGAAVGRLDDEMRGAQSPGSGLAMSHRRGADATSRDLTPDLAAARHGEPSSSGPADSAPSQEAVPAESRGSTAIRRDPISPSA